MRALVWVLASRVASGVCKGRLAVCCRYPTTTRQRRPRRGAPAAVWRLVVGMRKEVANPDRLIAAIAGRQHGVISFQQLIAAGLDPSGIWRRVPSGASAPDPPRGLRRWAQEPQSPGVVDGRDPGVRRGSGAEPSQRRDALGNAQAGGGDGGRHGPRQRGAISPKGHQGPPLYEPDSEGRNARAFPPPRRREQSSTCGVSSRETSSSERSPRARSSASDWRPARLPPRAHALGARAPLPGSLPPVTGFRSPR